MEDDPLADLLPDLEGDDEDWTSAWETVLDGKQEIESKIEEDQENDRNRKLSAKVWIAETQEIALDATTSFGGRMGDWVSVAEARQIPKSGSDLIPAGFVEIQYDSPAFFEAARASPSVPTDFYARCKDGSLALIVEDGQAIFVDRK